MNAIEVNQIYCANCRHKEKCYRPCPTVLIALYKDETK